MFRLVWGIICELRPKGEASASQVKIWREENIPEKQQMYIGRKTLKSSRKRNKASVTNG